MARSAFTTTKTSSSKGDDRDVFKNKPTGAVNLIPDLSLTAIPVKTEVYQ
jgi:hypothetical protein